MLSGLTIGFVVAACPCEAALLTHRVLIRQAGPSLPPLVHSLLVQDGFAYRAMLERPVPGGVDDSPSASKPPAPAQARSAAELYEASRSYNVSELMLGTQYNGLVEKYLAASRSGLRGSMEEVHTDILRHLQCVERSQWELVWDRANLPLQVLL